MMNKILKSLPTKKGEQNPASFRDPSGFVFSSNNSIYRLINSSYLKEYKLLISSGLYEKLVSLGYLIPHQQVQLAKSPAQPTIIQPQKIPFISYPYEWCFSMLKAAALLTLNIQKVALEYNMSLKDASAFNVQFLEGKPIFIDTLSFEKYREGKPWVAYKQFVEHFLTPLTLMSMNDIRLNRLSSLFIDGIPVDLTARLLPLRSYLKPALLLHIYAHASSQRRFSQKKLNSPQAYQSFSRHAFLGLIDTLESTVKNLSWNLKETQWSNYYEENNNYNEQSLTEKAELIRQFLKPIKTKVIWDIGANTGFFSRIAAESQKQVISFDSDYGALEKNYLNIAEDQKKNILPLFCDLTNPTPAVGWTNKERLSILQRGPADVILALALIHHLAIAQNIPLVHIAQLFSQMCNFLIIEFVPKEDSQVKKLLASREDIFPNYTQEDFEKVFKEFFQTKERHTIKQSNRTLYLMRKHKT